MKKSIKVGDIAIALERKKIKNMYLKVRPPEGEILICAPETMTLETIRMFALKKLPWIKKQQKAIQSRTREAPRHYIDEETHYLWGEGYLLKIMESNNAPRVTLGHKTILLQIPPECDREVAQRDRLTKQVIMAQWYREQLKQAIPPLIEKWQPIMGVKVNRFFVQQMKTKWGSCNVTHGNIRLNTELAKRPKICLEYVVVHEMTHLLEANHGKKFVALIDTFLPPWREYQEMLNSLPPNRDN
ncbi:M48 family metallopeptidase [Cyanobacterium sp. IPPAS B-1200]|uniref:M48 family metallopeptidase n=1 Tax=Cyanobacterium sp. IPPAS B-1200 TaxID=1562720 RepID=UPI003D491222